MKKIWMWIAILGGPQINASAYQTGNFTCNYSGVVHLIKVQDISVAPGVVLPYVEDVVTINVNAANANAANGNAADSLTTSTRGFAIVSNQANGQTLFFGDSSNGRVAIHFATDGQVSPSCH